MRFTSDCRIHIPVAVTARTSSNDGAAASLTFIHDMHPRIQEVLDHLDTNRRELRSSVDSVPEPQRQLKADADAWSVVEVLEHLAIVETNVARMLERKIAEGREAGLGQESETSSVLDGGQDAKVRDRSFKIVTGEATAPKSSLAPPDAWDAVERSREALRRVILDADGLALGEVSAPHRIFGPLTAYQWLAFIGSHESRHAAQIRDIGARLAVARG